MPSNDDCVMGIPQIQCPTCACMLDVSSTRRIDKFSKAQRRKMQQAQNVTGSTRGDKPYQFNEPTAPEDMPSEAPERNFVLASCGNHHCDQYNKFKVLELPRIKVSTAKVEL